MIKQILKFIQIQIVALAVVSVAACSDDETFSISTDKCLSFPVDTLDLDTVFSGVPTSHRQFVIHNDSGDGLRVVNARLQKGNQTGFRVNVNGSYLGKESGYQVNDLEVRKGDSLRVFVELTTSENDDSVPRLVEDDLVFLLESGVRQKVNLRAMSWDADVLRDYHVTSDTVIGNANGKPILIFGTLTVDSLCTLSINAGTTLYFGFAAGMDVIGTLKVNGEAGKEVTMRCDRFDKVVSNLTYDNNPGQWGSIRLRDCSFGNVVTFADIHGCTTAFQCDSSLDATRQKLTLRNATLHNMKGYGVNAQACKITMENCQVSNALMGCLRFMGGDIYMNHCTVPQYYPFSASRGAAVRFSNTVGDNFPCPLKLHVINSLVTGYADDVITWSRHENDSILMDVHFDNCQLRTDYHSWTYSKEETERDSLMFATSWLEDVKDTLYSGRNTFMLFDTHYFQYDFTPKHPSLCIGKADAGHSLPIDRKGKARSKETPDVGCYEVEEKTSAASDGNAGGK